MHYNFQSEGTHTSHNFPVRLKHCDLKTFRNSYMEGSHEEREEHVAATGEKEETRQKGGGGGWEGREGGGEGKRNEGEEGESRGALREGGKE